MDTHSNILKRLDWLDKAKGFAILGVVACHTVNQFTIKGTIANIAQAGMYGVSLFFIISSFLTYLSLDRNTPLWNFRSYFIYLLRKIIRLAPVLYIAILWHIIQYCISLGKIPELSDSIWCDTFFAATFTNSFSYHHFNPWCNWYIGTLVVFYIFAPLLHKYINTPSRSVIFLAATMVFTWIINQFIYPYKSFYDSFFYYCSLPKQMPVLAIGIVLYQFKKNYSLQDLSKSISLFLMIIATFYLLTICTSIHIIEFHVTMGFLLLLLTASIFTQYSWKPLNAFNILGKHSYGIYLFHWCLIKPFNTISIKIGMTHNTLICFFVYYILIFSIALFVSYLVHKFIEKPFFQFIKMRNL